MCWQIIVNCLVYDLNRTGKETERIVSVAMVVSSLVVLSKRLLPGMAKWKGSTE